MDMILSFLLRTNWPRQLWNDLFVPRTFVPAVYGIAVLDRQRVQAGPEIFEAFLRLGTVHVVILPIMPPQGIQAWLWAVLLKNDFILPDISLELPDVFVHSITLHKKCV